MHSHGLSDQQKKFYLQAVLAGTAEMLGAKNPNAISDLAVQATSNPYERLDRRGNRIRNFHTFGHVTRSAEEVYPEMEQVRKYVEDYVRRNETALKMLPTDNRNQTLAGVYVEASLQAFGFNADCGGVPVEIILRGMANKPGFKKMFDAAGLNRTGIMHDLVYYVDKTPEPQWLEYITKGNNALLKLSDDGKNLEWNERGKATMLYKLLAPMEGKDKPFDLEAPCGALGPYPLDLSKVMVYGELLSAVTAAQHDLDQGMPKKEQLRRAVEIIGTYFCKSESFSDELFDRFNKLGNTLGMSGNEIVHDYEVAISFPNKFDIGAFKGIGEGLESGIHAKSRFVDELEPNPANRDLATVTDFDRANMGAAWFNRDIVLVGLIKGLELQLADDRVPPALHTRIKEFLAPYRGDDGKIDGEKLDREFGSGTAKSYESVKPLEIFRSLPRAVSNGHSPNNYVVGDTKGNGIDILNVTKLEANFRAAELCAENVRALQAIAATEMLVGALLHKEGMSDTPTWELNIQPLKLDGKTPAGGLNANVMQRLKEPETMVDIFGEDRPAGHPNNKIAASLLELVGHEKMAELASLQAKIVMGAKPADTDARRKALVDSADEIISKAEQVFGNEVVEQLRQNVHKAVESRDVPTQIDNASIAPMKRERG